MRRAIGLGLLVGSLLAFRQELPPPFPRPGATLLLENEAVRVWDIAWLRQSYPLHRHPYDMTGVYYQSGDRVIISPAGERRSTHTEAWNITFQRAGLTHSEEGTSDVPLRAVFIEMKQSGPGAATSPPAPPPSPPTLLDNDRVSVRGFNAMPAVPSPHAHAAGAVLVWFDPSGRPSVRYVGRGEGHEADAPPDAARWFVFELK